ncbi:MAG: asparagine synthase (glutamine-hydrolyzing) [Acidimicrobiia bacterium]|nr:asparagine synthase (glutamine-hydrolyzing) [Acidimicrobiia bacterium]
MCGICGAFALDGPLDPAIVAALPAMTASLAHRGPDAGATFADSVAALGHRRLSIIDVAGGAQPIANEDESCWIVFNGEIYNHRDLRRDLVGRGHQFRTHSDTETILHGYEELGPAVVDRLEGMFAFAIYDARRRELFLARDRLGKKPLFYATFAGVLHFASEIKALYRSPVWDGTVDGEAIEGYLSLGYVLGPGTIHRHVRKLGAGEWLKASGRGTAIRRYWDVPVFDTLPASADVVSEIEATLATTVRDRLESEVPLGAFLSGGIDSGLVVSFMADAAPAALVTASVGFAEAAHNELAAARLTADRYRSHHHEAVIEPRLDDVLDRVVAAFDEPFADASAIPTWYVSQIARRHVTVALSGDGGDEAWGGYSFRYVPHALEGYVRRGGASVRSLAAWAGRHWPSRPWLPKPLRLATILANIARDPAAAWFFDLCVMRPATVRELIGAAPTSRVEDMRVYEPATEPYRTCPSASPLQRAMYADLKIYLQHDVLVKVDRMSMQHGLEVRCPLLDRRVVELAFRTPASRKMPRLRPKRLLRAVAERRLPADLLRLPKHGFSAPVGAWLRGAYAGMFQDQVLDRPGLASLVDVRVVRRLFDEHRAGRADHGQALWTIWMLERWEEVSSRAEMEAREQVEKWKSGKVEK